MFDLSTIFLLIFYGLSTFGLGFAIGRNYLRIAVWMREHAMSNAKNPKAVATVARKKLEEVEMHLGDADRELEQLAKRELAASRARTSIWKALWSLVQVPGMKDNGDNGNGQNGAEQ